jgi:hypothetical protein
MPDPIIEPTTIAISAGSASFWTVDDAIEQCLRLEIAERGTNGRDRPVRIEWCGRQNSRDYPLDVTEKIRESLKPK